MVEGDKRDEPSTTVAKEDGEVSPDKKQDDKHMLEHKWTLWYDAGSSARTNNQGQWGTTLRSVYTFDSVEDFWCLYNNIKPPSALAHGADFHLFKYGIEPKWEDPMNASGGKWTVNVPRGEKGVLDQYWLNILVACIGEHFTEGEDICGVVINVRTKGDRLNIWTRTASDESIQTQIGKQVKKVLDLDETTRLGYSTFEDAKDNRNPRDKYSA